MLDSKIHKSKFQIMRVILMLFTFSALFVTDGYTRMVRKEGNQGILPYKTVRDVTDYEGKVVYMRVDFNVPLKVGEISSDTRIRKALPTIQYLIDKGAKIVLATHLGRPGGEFKPELSTKILAERLSQLLRIYVAHVEDCKGQRVNQAVQAMNDGDVLMLENVRFYSEEKSKDPEVMSQHAREMAEAIGAEIFIADGPAVFHRGKQASVGPISEFIDGSHVIGLLAEKELTALTEIVEGAEVPTALVVGGKKIGSKLKAVKALAENDRLDLVIFDGAIANVILKAQGHEVGQSFLGKDEKEIEENLELAEETLGILDTHGIKYVTPVDFKLKSGDTVQLGMIPPDGVIVDIGPESQGNVIDALSDTEILGEDLTKIRIIRSGTAGMNDRGFADGTNAIIDAIATHPTSKKNKIILGGDGEDAVRKFFSETADNYFFIFTSGGAALTFLAKGRKGLTALNYIDTFDEP